VKVADDSGDLIARRIWWGWLLVCLVAVSVYLLTLGKSPMVLQDEVQIVELGRTVWEPTSDWSLAWNVQKSTPVTTLTYVGVGLQELGYRLASGSLWGPRFLGLLAGIAAATCLLGLLLARETHRLTALVVSAMFLIDPIFSGIYLRGRIDGWAIAACLGACWLLCLARVRFRQNRNIKWHVFCAGALTGLSPFLWTTALMLFPLIILECYYSLKMVLQSSKGNALSQITTNVAAFIFGGLLVVLIAFLPIVTQWEAYWQGLLISMEIQGQAAGIQKSVVDLFLVYDPLLVLTLFTALIIRRETGLIVALVVAYFMMKLTMVYLPRVLYLIPYFMLIIAGASNEARRLDNAPWRKVLMTAMLIVALAVNAGSTLVMRTYRAVVHMAETDSSQIYNAFNNVIGPGSYRVLLEEWEGYYAARDLGWKIYRAGAPVSRLEYLEFAKTMDYVVIRNPENSKFPQLSLVALREAGFELSSTLTFEQSAYPPLLVFTNSN
jgi:hypothetical protein